MTPTGVVVALGVAAAFGGAALLVRPAAVRHGLGLVHPGFIWLGLAALFLGAGSAILALTGEAVGPALYVGGSAVAFAIGLAASDRLALRRGGGDAGGGDGAGVAPGADGSLPAVRSGARRWAPLLLAAVAIGAIVPTLVRHGIPFLSVDITGSRSELTGLQVQLVRVALPGLATVFLFRAARIGDRRSALAAAAAVGVIAAFDILLASRYLVAELGAVLVVAWLLAGRRLPVRAIVVLAVVALVGFAGIQVLRAYSLAAGNELGFAAGRTVNRVVMVQPRTLAALQRVIPAEEPYFLGLTWVHRLGPLLGREDIPNLGYWIYPKVVEGPQDTAGYAAPGLIGEAWANFGPAGLLLFVPLGVLAEWLGALAAKRRGTAVDLAAAGMAALFLGRTHALGAGGLLILLAIVVAWRILAGPLAGLGWRGLRPG